VSQVDPGAEMLDAHAPVVMSLISSFPSGVPRENDVQALAVSPAPEVADAAVPPETASISVADAQPIRSAISTTIMFVFISIPSFQINSSIGRNLS